MEKQQTALLSSLLARKRNLLLPIFRVPSEIFAIIFIHGARDYYESDDSGRFSTHIPTWVNVSYVCSRWRNVALNCTALWAYPFNVSLRWTEELLLRSKQAPLKVSCIYPSRQHKEVSWWLRLLDDLLKHAGRIQELRLDVPPSFLPTGFSLSAPRLERMEVSLRQDIPMKSITIIDGDKLPLHTLKLANCSLSWYSLNLSGLTTLSLCGVRSPSPLNMIEFLAVLSSMQDLTILRLEHVLPSPRGFLSSGSLDVSPQISLPYLALLAVIEPLSSVVALLSRFDVPSKTQLSLDPLAEHGSSMRDYAPISSFLAEQFSIPEPLSSPCSTFRSLAIDGSYPTMLTFSSLERDCRFRVLTRGVSDPSIPLEITLGEEDEESDDMDDMEEIEGMTDSDVLRITSDICCSLPLTNVQTLHVTEHGFSSAFWKDILGRLNGLRFMKLSYGYMPDLSMLSLTTNEHKENPGGKPAREQDPTLGYVFVPFLEELELFRISFIPDDTTSRGFRMSQKSLFSVLSTRKGLLDRLTMIECGVEAESDG